MGRYVKMEIVLGLYLSIVLWPLNIGATSTTE